MKKINCILIMLLLLVFATINVEASERIEIDYGITFELSEDWEESEFETEPEILKYKYESDEHGTLMIGVMDAYSQMEEDEKKGISRGDVDNSIITADDIRDMFKDEYDVKEITTETYGDYEFYVVDLTYSYTVENIVGGEVVPNTSYSPAEFDVIVYNGYMILLEHFNFTRGPVVDENGVFQEVSSSAENHIEMLKSFDLSSIEPDESKIGFNNTGTTELLVSLTISLVMTIFVYLLVPTILIVSRRKYQKRTLKTIVIINGVIGFIVFNILRGLLGDEVSSNAWPAILWSSIAYWLMKKAGIMKNNEETSSLLHHESDCASTVDEKNLIQEKKEKKQVLQQPKLLAIAIVSAILVPVLIVFHILAENASLDIGIFYIINDSLAFFVLPAIFVISLIVLISSRRKKNTISIRRREKCYKKVAQIQEYLEKGIITPFPKFIP